MEASRVGRSTFIAAPQGHHSAPLLASPRRDFPPRWTGKFEMKMILMLVSAAVLATAAGAEPLVVVEGDARSTVRVAYDDLNLGSARGRERLTDRVTAAVRTMCRDDNRDLLAIELGEQRCYTDSIREAGGQIDQAVKARTLGFASGSQSIAIVRR